MFSLRHTSHTHTHTQFRIRFDSFPFCSSALFLEIRRRLCGVRTGNRLENNFEFCIYLFFVSSGPSVYLSNKEKNNRQNETSAGQTNWPLVGKMKVIDFQFDASSSPDDVCTDAFCCGLISICICIRIYSSSHGLRLCTLYISSFRIM